MRVEVNGSTALFAALTMLRSRMFLRLLLTTSVVLASPVSAQAAPLLDARAAQAIVAGCVIESGTKTQSHAIAVVDTGGHLIAALRMDGNGSGIFEFAVAKAEAAAAWGFSTAQMLEASRVTPGFDRAQHVVIVAGGLPVFTSDGKALIGAVGVSGEAPADDAACAQAGIRAAGLRSVHS
jgi:glc operon protein GlcG